MAASTGLLVLVTAAAVATGGCRKREAPAAPAARALPRPVRPSTVGAPFLMPIEDVFSIAGRGTIVTGRIERGTVKVGDEVAIVGIRATTTTVVMGVETFRKLLDQAGAGANVGLLLRGMKRDDVERGQVVAKPGSIEAHRRIRADVHMLSKAEGGRSTPVFDGYRPQFWFRTTDHTGRVTLPPGVRAINPGDDVSAQIDLLEPIACEVGMHFAIREGGKTVGAGVVTQVL